MMPEAAIVERLLDIGAVTAIVADRVFMLKLPQAENRPSLRVQRIPGTRGQHLRGPDGTYRTRMQVDSYVAEAPGIDAYASITALADAVLGDGLGDNASGLFGWRGVLGGSPDMIRIHNIEVLNGDTAPFYEPGELRQLRIEQDYMVHWSEL